jgi:hypothetical protein
MAGGRAREGEGERERESDSERDTEREGRKRRDSERGSTVGRGVTFLPEGHVAHARLLEFYHYYTTNYKDYLTFKII